MDAIDKIRSIIKTTILQTNNYASIRCFLLQERTICNYDVFFNINKQLILP